MKIFYFVIHCFLVYIVGVEGSKVQTQDQTSPRPNTLFDDPDDIQKQLDNEARDRIKLGKLKTVWVFHLPTQPRLKLKKDVKRKFRQATFWRKKTTTQRNKLWYTNPDIYTGNYATTLPPWDYTDQDKWVKDYPTCGGSSQSPVDIPRSGLGKTRGARKMIFSNYDTSPTNLRLYNDGKTVTLYGDWARSDVPVIYGGAAHNRCYLFHSMVLHWPSEHAVGGLLYPLETQALFVSSIYGSIEEALDASNSDQLAFLSLSTLYKYSNGSHEGILDLVTATINSEYGNYTMKPQPFSVFSPLFKDYAVYHGSLTHPPCTESVLWLIRARSLPITRELIQELQEKTDIQQTLRFNTRKIQRMNDRKIYMFH